MMLNVVVLEQQMQAKRDAAEAAAAAAELEENDDDDDDVFDGGPAGPGEAGKLVAIRRSPSGDSFATLATEQQLDKLDKRFVGDSRLELSGLQDRLSVASVHSPGDYIALPTVSSLSLFTVLPRLPNVVENVEGSKHRKSLILLKKLVFISNFNVFILMFVIYFLS